MIDKMIVYRWRSDGVFEGEVELDRSPIIPPFHTFEAPPAALAGHYIVMRGGWIIMPGDVPDTVSTALHLVPQSVTMRQARLALLKSGKLSSVDAVLAAIPDAAARTEAQITWEYSTAVERNHPLIGALGAGLGMNDGAIDDLFRLADTL